MLFVESHSLILFPWEKNELPEATTVLKDIFHFHPDIHGNTTDYDEILHFHLTDRSNRSGLKSKPCLSQIFGISLCREWEYASNDEETLVEQTTYLSWLQRVMLPTRRIKTGQTLFNPYVELFLTNLAPGWLGGTITAQLFTF